MVVHKHRALVLQGGGALGAYELGAFETFYDKLPEIDSQENEPNRPLFDVIAGTSIGAINAAIIVSNFKKRKSWADSLAALQGFWNHVESEPDIDPYIRYWDELHGQYPDAASKEAARRYHSSKYYQTYGAHNVFSRPTMQLDEKFFDNGTIPNNIWFRYNNDALRRSLEKFAQFPISTTFEHKEPRLLITAVDVRKGTTVTFDSYSRQSKCGRYNYRSGRYEGYTLEYPDGVTVDHVMASAAIPIFYDYVNIEGHKFWDGSVLSNTPLRELIHKHKEYWQHKIGNATLESSMWNIDHDAGGGGTDGVPANIPDLEVYQVSVWPYTEEIIPTDLDGLKDRKNDITFSDKTEYDETVAILVTDYIDLLKKVRNIAVGNIKTQQERAKFEADLDKLLKTEKAQSRRNDTGENRVYQELLKGRVRLAGIVRIERQDDIHEISNKFADFSQESIDNLIGLGRRDALEAFQAA